MPPSYQLKLGYMESNGTVLKLIVSFLADIIISIMMFYGERRICVCIF